MTGIRSRFNRKLDYTNELNINVPAKADKKAKEPLKQMHQY